MAVNHISSLSSSEVTFKKFKTQSKQVIIINFKEESVIYLLEIAHLLSKVKVLVNFN